MNDDELTCQEFVELVTDYLEGALPSAERLRFESHMDDCPYCAAYLEQMRQTIQMVGQLSENTVPPEVKSDMLRRFRDWTR